MPRPVVSPAVHALQISVSAATTKRPSEGSNPYLVVHSNPRNNQPPSQYPVEGLHSVQYGNLPNTPEHFVKDTPVHHCGAPSATDNTTRKRPVIEKTSGERKNLSSSTDAPYSCTNVKETA